MAYFEGVHWKSMSQKRSFLTLYCTDLVNHTVATLDDGCCKMNRAFLLGVRILLLSLLCRLLAIHTELYR